jgi:hypothetical protein
MSHVQIVCTDETRVFVLKTDKYYRLPDSEIDGKLEWTRTDSKRLGLRTLKHIFLGLLTEPYIVQVSCEKACFGLQKEKRLVKVIVKDLPLLVSFLEASMAYHKVSCKVKTIESLSETLSIESAHILEEKMCWERGSNPRGVNQRKADPVEECT